MAKVTQEVAQSEINNWLDKRRVFQSQKEQNKASIDLLADAIVEGCLTYDPPSGKLTQKFLFPLGDGGVTKEIVWGLRLNQRMQNPHMKGVDIQDIEGRFAAMTAALTDSSKSLYMEMDAADSRIAKAILVFFL